VSQPKDLVGISGGVSIMLFDIQICFMVQQPVYDMYGIPCV
jgi:hypothetical protein